jgi:hypothetical protein
VSGTTQLNALGQDVTLDNPANDFGGAVSATANNLVLVDKNEITLGDITAGGTLGVNAVTGNVSQVAGTTVTAAGAKTITAPNGLVARELLPPTLPAIAAIAPPIGVNAPDIAIVAPISPLSVPAVSVSVVGESGASQVGSSAPGPQFSAPQGSGSAAPVSSGNVVVMQVRDATPTAQGRIQVEVNRQTVLAGAFEFALPAQAIQSLQSATTLPVALLSNNQPLPNWLRFNPQTRKFTAENIPADALPLQVIVSSGNVRMAIEITEMR